MASQELYSERVDRRDSGGLFNTQFRNRLGLPYHMRSISEASERFEVSSTNTRTSQLWKYGIDERSGRGSVFSGNCYSLKHKASNVSGQSACESLCAQRICLSKPCKFIKNLKEKKIVAQKPSNLEVTSPSKNQESFIRQEGESPSFKENRLSPKIIFGLANSSASTQIKRLTKHKRVSSSSYLRNPSLNLQKVPEPALSPILFSCTPSQPSPQQPSNSLIIPCGRPHRRMKTEGLCLSHLDNLQSQKETKESNVIIQTQKI